MARAHDYDRYLAVLMGNSRAQPAQLTLLAFQHELAKTAESVSEEPIGMIRLKWWQEAIELILAGASPRQHPVVLSMATLPEAVLTSLIPLIEVRLQDVTYRKGFPDKATFDAYLEQSAGAFHAALLSCEGAEADETPRTLILRAGRFYALVGLIRAMPYHLERGIIRWPLDVLKQYGISPAAIEQGVEKEAFAHLMDYWLRELQQLSAELSEPVRALPSNAALIKRLHLVALLYAQEIARNPYHPAQIAPQLPNLALRLWWHEKRGFKRLETPLSSSSS